jgi:hypothetical protein
MAARYRYAAARTFFRFPGWAGKAQPEISVGDGRLRIRFQRRQFLFVPLAIAGSVLAGIAFDLATSKASLGIDILSGLFSVVMALLAMRRLVGCDELSIDGENLHVRKSVLGMATEKRFELRHIRRFRYLNHNVGEYTEICLYFESEYCPYTLMHEIHREAAAQVLAAVRDFAPGIFSG